MSQKMDLEDRRKVVARLRAEGQTMPTIAKQLGISVWAVFRDIQAIRRLQHSCINTGSEETLPSSQPSTNPENAKRREKRKYRCLSCNEEWSGSGDWRMVRIHLGKGCMVMQGNSPIHQGASQNG